MKVLKRIADDIKRGENIDLYLAVAAAIVTGVLALVGIGTAVQVTALTLTVLALLAFAMLQSRHSFQQSIGDLRNSLNATRLFVPEMPNLKDHLKKARTISINGISLVGTSDTLWQVFADRLQDGAHIRLLVVDPDHPAVAVAASRFHKHQDPERLRTEIRHALDNLDSLHSRAANGGSLEIRFAPFNPPYGIWIIDGERPEAEIWVELYCFRAAPEPTFSLLPHRDITWFEYFQNQFELMWEASKPNA